MLPQTPEEAVHSKYGETNVQELGRHYGQLQGDSPLIDSEQLMEEWSDLSVYMSLHCSSKTMKEMLQILAKHGSTLSTVYPNFTKLAQVCMTLPISTADCERAFSTMRRIKSRLRSQMSNITLNHCMRVPIEGPPLEDFDFDTSLDTWSKLRNRRIL